ncbi:hypothetical protein, partial [Marinobacter sp. SS5-14b]|uniref:hypothetical protein n=1 Tax=Marinobacter sp. SS5-14b TaxID=3050456 RepID=UPI0026DEC690
GNRQKSNKTEGDNAKIALEWLFFELKSDSAINQALIRPSLEKLQDIGIYTIVVTAKLYRAHDLPHFDMLVSGANSYSSCTRAAEFISNQLSCNLQQSSRFIILPTLKSSRQKRMKPT